MSDTKPVEVNFVVAYASSRETRPKYISAQYDLSAAVSLLVTAAGPFRKLSLASRDYEGDYSYTDFDIMAATPKYLEGELVGVEARLTEWVY